MGNGILELAVKGCSIMGRDSKWDKFAELIARCYKAAENGNTLNACWIDAFNALMDVIAVERMTDSRFARELGDLEKITDFKFNIEGLILDYFDRLWKVGNYQEICTSGDRIITTFDWNVESSSPIRTMVVNSLMKMGKKDEALQYCLEWIKAEPEDVNAAMIKKALLADADLSENNVLPDMEGEESC